MTNYSSFLTDAADAQYVWNMYNAQYADIDAVITIPESLSADMNGDKVVDMYSTLSSLLTRFLAKATDKPHI